MYIAQLNGAVAKGEITRDRIKSAARQLFAQYGLDRVTIRDIAKFAGQRNGGSVNYYFGSKEELIRLILNDAAAQLEKCQGKMLSDLEASGKIITIRDLLKVLVSVSGDETDEQMRLVTMLQIARRDLMHTEIPGRWDQAYNRCVAHLRKLLPAYPEKILTQRLYFLIPYLWTFLATQEQSTDQADFWKEFWADPSSMESLLDTAEGILVQPPSPHTLAMINSERPTTNVA